MKVIGFYGFKLHAIYIYINSSIINGSVEEILRIILFI